MLNQIITNAHMAGQRHAGCKHPSWGDALGYSHSVLPGTLEKAARQYIEESPGNSPIAPVQHAQPAICAHFKAGSYCVYWPSFRCPNDEPCVASPRKQQAGAQ
jgi:hypothetical protein